MEDSLAVEDDEVMSTTSQTSVDTRSGDGKLLFARATTEKHYTRREFTCNHCLCTDFANEGADDSFEEIEVNSEQLLDDHLDGATQKRFDRHVFLFDICFV